MKVSFIAEAAIRPALERWVEQGWLRGSPAELARNLAQLLEEDGRLISTEEAGVALAEVVSGVTGKKVAYFGG